HAEELEYRDMLAGLGHHAVVGGYHDEREIDPARAGHHGVHQTLVSGHVDEAEHAAVRERRVGVTELDRDATPLLLLEAIGVHAGERSHQRGLAVIDVAGRADDHGLSIASSAANAASSPGSTPRRSSHRVFSARRPITGRGSARSAAARRSRLA